jgi:hypothetical protein
MMVGQGPNWGCSAKGKKIYTIEYQNHKTEAQQFPPTIFKHLMMKNVARNV